MILWTRPDGGVSITVPSPTCMLWMQYGGRWADMPAGFLDTQIERNIADGVLEPVAERFCRALAFGGLTRSEALAVLRDRDCRNGMAHEIIDPAGLPDRWFRDAWRRSHNGGPIWLDVEDCRRIQWERVQTIAYQESRKLRPREINLGSLRDAILAADEPETIRRVWPHGLA